MIPPNVATDIPIYDTTLTPRKRVLYGVASMAFWLSFVAFVYWSVQ